MYALIRKDLIACRLFLLLGFGIYMIYAVATFRAPVGYFLINMVVTILMVMAPMGVNEKYRVDSLVCFLPPSRKEVVFARYVMGLMALLSGLSLQYGLGAILNGVFGWERFSTLCSPQAALVFCAVPILFVCLYLPCFFRFGLGRGIAAFALLVLGLVVVVSSPLLAVNFFSPDTRLDVTQEMMDHPEEALVAIVDHFKAPVGAGVFYSLSVALAIILVASSMVISVRMYESRDL